MARRITVAHLGAIGTLTALVAGRPAGGAVPLPSLGGASVQTLIDLGGDGVIAGDERYFNFTYVATPTAPAANAVRVQEVPATGNGNGNGNGGGIKFVAAWLAAAGASETSTISFDVAPVDPATDAIAQVNLLSNGTAAYPAAGTFVTTSAWATTPAGQPATLVLTTFDDGPSTQTVPTLPDTDAQSGTLAEPQSQLSMTETLTAVAGPGGVATASVVQNGFTLVPAIPTAPVPEPVAAAVGLVAVMAGLGVRRHGRP